MSKTIIEQITKTDIIIIFFMLYMAYYIWKQNSSGKIIIY